MVEKGSDLHAYNPVAEQVLLDITEKSIYITEVTYWTFSIYTIFLAEIFKEVALILPKEQAISKYWNIIDGVCVAIYGIGQIINPSPDPTADKIKGVINLAGSVQLIWLTLAGLSLEGFLIATGIGVLISLYNTFKTCRKLADEKYWRQDTSKHRFFYEKEQLKINHDIERLEKLDPKNTAHIPECILNWLISRKQMRQDEASRTFENLTAQLSEYDDNGIFPTNEVKKELFANLTDNLFWTLTFTGLLFLFIPGLELTGVILVAASLLVLLYNYKDSIKEYLFESDDYEPEFTKSQFTY